MTTAGAGVGAGVGVGVGLGGTSMAVTVFEFTCSDCGPFKVIPVDVVRRHINDMALLRCPAA
jgi:hypothetical protein